MGLKFASVPGPRVLPERTDALAIMRDVVTPAPGRPWGHAMLAIILAQLGRREDPMLAERLAR